MGHARDRHREKVRQQKINKQENDQYYQHEGDWKWPATEMGRNARRKLNVETSNAQSRS